MAPLSEASESGARGRIEPLLQVVFRAEHAADATGSAIVELGEALVSQSRKEGLVGLFCAQGSVFTGLVEGQSDEVIGLIEGVSKDVRLSGLVTLREAHVQKTRMGNAVFSYLTAPDAPNSETASARAFADKLARRLQLVA